MVPKITVIGDTGITNYYEGTSNYYEGGWPGGGSDTSYYGTYYTNIRTGEKKYVERYSENAHLAYLDKDQKMKENGLFYGKVFVVPTAEQLDGYYSMGYTVDITSTTITVYNSATKVIWNTINKTILKEWYENDTLKTRVFVNYTQNDLLDVAILSEIVETYPKHFENGDCYDEFVITYFTDYSLCGAQVQLRDKNTSSSIREISDLILSPNPVMGELNIEFPTSIENGFLDVLSVNGKLIRKLLIKKGQSSIKVDLDNIESGIYIVKIKSSDKTLIKKFVKQ